jgi:L-ribulose-5-phosphate 3-epimerase
MIKSINTWVFDPKRSLSEAFGLAKQHGFDGVEVTISDDKFPTDTHLTLQSTADDCARWVQEANAAGVQIVSVASGLGWKLPLTTNDQTLRQQAMDATARSLQLTQWLQTDALLVVPGSVSANFEPSYDVAYDNALSAVRELVPTAEKCGVAIGIENVWNKFLLSPLEMRAFIDAAQSTWVGSYFDVGNVVVTGFPEQWIRILGDRIKRVHLKDFKRSDGTINGFCDLLDGDVDYPAVMQELRQIGYNGAVTAEFFDCEDQLPAISAAIDKIVAM